MVQIVKRNSREYLTVTFTVGTGAAVSVVAAQRTSDGFDMWPHLLSVERADITRRIGAALASGKTARVI